MLCKKAASCLGRKDYLIGLLLQRCSSGQIGPAWVGHFSTTVVSLLHAADTVMLHHKHLGHITPMRRNLDKELAAQAATSAGGDRRMR